MNDQLQQPEDAKPVDQGTPLVPRTPIITEQDAADLAKQARRELSAAGIEVGESQPIGVRGEQEQPAQPGAAVAQNARLADIVPGFDQQQVEVRGMDQLIDEVRSLREIIEQIRATTQLIASQQDGTAQ